MTLYDNDTLRRLLTDCRTIAVVGISSDPVKPSHYVPKYLQHHGYRIVPVNPRYHEVLGETCYPSLAAIPFPVDMVNVFRPAADCPPVAADAAAIHAKVLWLQLGIASEEARRIAEAAGMTVVMDRCIKVEHARLGVEG
jgi:predicted CoA-binding protein